MFTESKTTRMNTQYLKMKAEAKKLMLKGDLKNYFNKLLQITALENECRRLMADGEMKAAA